MKKKRVFISAIVALLAVVAIGGTLAFMTSKDTVTNTFVVGDVKLHLDEAKVDLYGKVEGTDRVDANTYKLIPNHSYVKDPTVTVEKDSEACFVRLIVTMDKASALAALHTTYPNLKLEDVFTGIGNNWTKVGTPVVDAEANTITYEFRYNNVVPATTSDTALQALFTGFKVPGEWTQTEVATLTGMKINVVAHAIQADGFTTAEDAWAKFPTE